jgi:hypothetical protein
MDEREESLGQVASLCRQYPSVLTSAELVGGAFLLLGHVHPIEEKVRILAEGLGEKERRTLSEAAADLIDSAGDADGFKLGAAFRPVEEGLRGIHVGDQLIPMAFAHAIGRSLHPRKSRGSSAVG